MFLPKKKSKKDATEFWNLKLETSNLTANIFIQLNKPNYSSSGLPTLSINFDDSVDETIYIDKIWK